MQGLKAKSIVVIMLLLITKLVIAATTSENAIYQNQQGCMSCHQGNSLRTSFNTDVKQSKSHKADRIKYS